ncbi:hypothetical protein ACE6H2_022165 [Prunus campanulata]
MGIPPVRAPRITKYLKPYVLKMHFTNKYVTAQVIHTPTATVASSASSQEKALRESMEIRRDVAAAGKIGKILGERLLLKNIPAISVQLKREQKYRGKVKAVVDSVVEAVEGILVVSIPGPMTFRSLPLSSLPLISPSPGVRLSLRSYRQLRVPRSTCQVTLLALDPTNVPDQSRSSIPVRPLTPSWSLNNLPKSPRSLPL